MSASKRPATAQTRRHLPAASVLAWAPSLAAHPASLGYGGPPFSRYTTPPPPPQRPPEG